MKPVELAATKLHLASEATSSALPSGIRFSDFVALGKHFAHHLSDRTCQYRRCSSACLLALVTAVQSGGLTLAGLHLWEVETHHAPETSQRHRHGRGFNPFELKWRCQREGDPSSFSGRLQRLVEAVR